MSAMAFVRDRESDEVIRQCFADLGLQNGLVATGTLDTALASLPEGKSPDLLIVDLQGVDDPIARIRVLANVCEPTTGLIAIGPDNDNDIRIYRALKSEGVVEYYYKPLVRSLVLQTCQSILTGTSTEPPARTGKLISVLGVRGGAGATTIATATAWHLARTNRRQVAFIDLDLQYGDAALQFDAPPSDALKEALDHPERVDEAFLDRAMIDVDDRLGLLAGLHGLDEAIAPPEAAVLSLIEVALRRYRYVFLDIPATLAPHLKRVLQLPGTLLLVSSSSLVSARDVARWRALIGPNSAERSMLHILNAASRGNGLPPEEFERIARGAPDIEIPASRQIAVAARLGVRGLQDCRTFQRAMAPLLRQLSGAKPPASRWPWPLSLLG